MAIDATDAVRRQYGETARSGLTGQHASVQAVAQAFGYSADELASIPADANLGLSCGNPLATAHLRPGETVVDLGSGGGLDVFLAAQKVGPRGRAIGIDMTEEMIQLARRNAQRGPDGQPYANVEFRLGTIDNLPLESETVDVVISNCVINLASDKPRVFREIFRVLRPGGRVAISDIALKQALPEELAENVAALVGCIAGAISIEAYQTGLQQAGFRDVAVLDSGADLNAYAMVDGQAACCAPVPAVQMVSLGAAPSAAASCCGGPPAPASLHGQLADLLRRYDINAYAASVRVLAVKPK